jgi:hypothetical protein
MTGLCKECGALTATRSQREVEGCRVGYVVEYADEYSQIMCLPCIHAYRPTSVQPDRNAA